MLKKRTTHLPHDPRKASPPGVWRNEQRCWPPAPNRPFLKAVPLGIHNKISWHKSSPPYTDEQKPRGYENIAQSSAGSQWPSSFEPRPSDERLLLSALCHRVSGSRWPDRVVLERQGPWAPHQSILTSCSVNLSSSLGWVNTILALRPRLGLLPPS